MIAPTTNIPSRVRRCAVCKIDMKGRFVVVDEETEALLGMNQFDLFARPFTDFMAESDHHVLEAITSHRNRYETFHDSACLMLRTNRGQIIPVTIAVSLNFDAGSPVNYQIIIIPQTDVDTESHPTAGAIFLDRLLRLDSLDDPQRLVADLRLFTSAQFVELLEGDDAQFTLLAGSGEVISEPGEDNAADPTTPPGEFRLPLKLNSDCTLLLRFGYQGNNEADAVADLRSKAELAMAMLRQRLAGSSTENNSAQQSPEDMMFRLEELSIAAVLFDAKHQIVQATTAAQNELGSTDDCKSIAEFGAKLTDDNDQGVAEIASMCEAVTTNRRVATAEFTITLADHSPALAVVQRCSANPEDRSGVLLWHRLPTRPAPRMRRKAKFSQLKQVLAHTRTVCSVAEGIWSKLSHEVAGKLTKVGKGHVVGFGHQMLKVSAALESLERTANLLESPDTPQPVDLDLLLTQIEDGICSSGQGVRLAGTHRKLPTVFVPRQKITVVIESIMGAIMGVVTGETVEMKARAETTDDSTRLLLTFVDSGKLAERLTKSSENYYDGFSSIDGRSALPLAFGRYLLEEMGGRLTINNDKNDCLLVGITLPESKLPTRGTK